MTLTPVTDLKRGMTIRVGMASEATIANVTRGRVVKVTYADGSDDIWRSDAKVYVLSGVLTRAAKERAVAGMASRYGSWTEAAKEACLTDDPDFPAIQRRADWAHRALLRLAMARTVD